MVPKGSFFCNILSSYDNKYEPPCLAHSSYKCFLTLKSPGAQGEPGSRTERSDLSFAYPWWCRATAHHAGSQVFDWNRFSSQELAS